MAGEYYRWLARNERPTEKRKLTPQEKWRNWWYYNKYTVLVSVLVLVGVVCAAAEVTSAKKSAVDYQIAYIGAEELSDDTVSLLESNIGLHGTDLTGDGAVTVEILQYILGAGADYDTEVRLLADLGAGNSIFFLCENPKEIQEKYGMFSYIDGTYPSESEDNEEKLWYSLDECKGLIYQDMAGYAPSEFESNGNPSFKMYLSRRGSWDGLDEERAKEYTRIYRLLLLGNEG